MKFEKIKYSKRKPEIEAAIFTIAEQAPGALIEWCGAHPPSVLAASYRATAAALIFPTGHYWIGVTLCSPQDQFVKSVGRAKAIGRSFQSYSATLHSHGQLILSDPTWVNALKENLHRAIAEFKACKGLL